MKSCLNQTQIGHLSIDFDFSFSFGENPGEVLSSKRQSMKIKIQSTLLHYSAGNHVLSLKISVMKFIKFLVFAFLFLFTTLSFKVSAQAELQDFLSGQVNGNRVFLAYDHQAMLDSINVLSDSITSLNASGLAAGSTPITNENIHAAVDLWEADVISAYTEYGHISSWNTSAVTDMQDLFKDSGLDVDISGWDVSNVTTMQSMFEGAEDFKQDINDWDVSNVTNMRDMFSGAEDFNQGLNDWDVSSVTNMLGMFYGAEKFNSNISNWNVSNVTTMKEMFKYASAFNRDISAWDVSNVTDMQGMFLMALEFNQNIGSWDVSSVTIMHRMFSVDTLDDVHSFNQDLSQWCVTNIPGEPNYFGNSGTDPVWGTCP